MGVGGSGSILVTVKSPEKPNPMGQGVKGERGGVGDGDKRSSYWSAGPHLCASSPQIFLSPYSRRSQGFLKMGERKTLTRAPPVTCSPHTALMPSHRVFGRPVDAQTKTSHTSAVGNLPIPHHTHAFSTLTHRALWRPKGELPGGAAGQVRGQAVPPPAAPRLPQPQRMRALLHGSQGAPFYAHFSLARVRDASLRRLCLLFHSGPCIARVRAPQSSPYGCVLITCLTCLLALKSTASAISACLYFPCSAPLSTSQHTEAASSPSS